MELGMIQRENLQPSQELARIEARIQYNLTSAYSNIVDIGRCLNEAKEKKLVPHGKWEQWIADQTGMSTEQAQRWMRIAREVPEGSYLSRLEISKIREILTLPAPQREEVAREAVESGKSVRELKSQVRDMKAALDETKRRAETAEEQVKNISEFAQRESRRVNDLQIRLEEALRATPEKGISAEAAKEIERLKGELADAEAFGNLQSEKRREAQMELLKLRNKEEDETDQYSPDSFMEAVYAFLRAAGQVPQMGKDFSLMSDADRRGWEIGTGMIADWLTGARSALSMVAAEVTA